MYYLPLLGALALAGGIVLQKLNLKKKKVDIKSYQTAEFFAIFLVMLPIIYFFWKLSPEALDAKNIFIFSLVIIFSIIANLFTFYSMKWAKVSNIEPAKMLEPVFTILLAIIFSFIFGEVLFERNTKIIIPALIAGAALLFSHIEKDHLKFSKYFIAAAVGSFFFALELVISKLILEFYSPISFYFIRCTAIFLISLIIFKPNLKEFGNKLKLRILAIGAIWVVYRVVIYYGYQNLGVIFTTLMIMLGPIFVYLFAWKFLKEKINRRNIIASIIIIGCVLYAVLG